jgi:hypothetical protein
MIGIAADGTWTVGKVAGTATDLCAALASVCVPSGTTPVDGPQPPARGVRHRPPARPGR